MKIQSLFSLCLLSLILFSCGASRQTQKEITNTFDTFPAFEQGFAGLVVYDPETQEIIYDHNGDKYFTPASNTKLFTFYAGLMMLGDSVPALEYAVNNDSLVFWATGDPTFLHPSYPESKTLDFLNNRKEKLFFAAPTYNETSFGPGWAWGDYNYSYSAERSAFPVHGNYVSLKFDPIKDIPAAAPTYFEKQLVLDSVSVNRGSRATRDQFSNRFEYRHNDRTRSREQEVPFRTSPELTVELLSDTLNKEVGLLKIVPAGFEKKTTLYSVPTDSVYKRMLQVSDNFLAEQVLLMAAKEVADSLKTEIAIDYMMENHLDDLPDDIRWSDGSGLSRYNLFTPRSVVELLKKIREEVPQERLFALLPAGGESGTIRNLYKAEEPYVFAKTGTLAYTHALSGYLKAKSGKVLIFSFLNSNYTVPSSEIKKGMEQILIRLRDNY